MATNSAVARAQSESWKESTRRDTEQALLDELKKLEQTSPPDLLEYWRQEFSGFRSIFGQFLQAKPYVSWDKCGPPPAGTIKEFASLKPAPDTQLDVAEQLKKLVVVKLNGGLGTSMGCKGPKSIIPVRHDLTFLDLTMQQIEHLNRKYNVDVPLVLMNSFNTDEDTKKILHKYKNVKVSVHTFNQSRYPRINKETYMPIAQTLQGKDLESWYPPGHGNFYEAFQNSGLLDSFLSQGKEYCFISNIDNLGATVDLSILNFMFEEKQEFVMEVTEKTRADVKGGTLVEYNGKLMLLEMAQVPPEHEDEFKSVSKFKIFNTNNLWCSLRATKELLGQKALKMEIIVNPKHLKINDQQGLDILQLETAAGAAIKNYKTACGINVPRSRFLPVKKTQDLLLIMSNLYELENGHLTLSSKRSFPTTPLVKLGTSFDKVSEFLKRFPGIPDLLELDHVTVSGDVTFGRNVSLKGTVIIIANHGDRIDIPPGALLENKIVSGNLRILDH
jgi:UTP--glucose-1-phosphate uridylyltransferase